MKSAIKCKTSLSILYLFTESGRHFLPPAHIWHTLTENSETLTWNSGSNGRGVNEVIYVS